MAIDRRGIVRGPDLNPVARVHASDDEARAIGADGMGVAQVGYQVIDRANPRSYFDKSRRGVAEPVSERPDVPWDERDIGHTIY